MSEVGYLDRALDAIALVRLAHEGENDELGDKFDVILAGRSDDEVIDLLWMLASLSSTMIDSWRDSLVILAPHLEDKLPTPTDLIQGMVQSLLEGEYTDA